MTLSQTLRSSPFVRILPLFVAGILLEPYLRPSAAVLWGVLVLLYALAWGLRRKSYGAYYLSVAVLLTALAAAQWQKPVVSLPRGERLLMSVEVDQSAVRRGDWMQGRAWVTAYRSYPKAGECALVGEWSSSSERIELYADTALHLERGDRLSVVAYVNDLGGERSSYRRLMWSRGVTGRAYLRPYSVVVDLPAGSQPWYDFQPRIHRWAVDRLSRLSLQESELNLLLAMVVGERRGLSAEVRDSYARTGCAHLLAVSGLHCGFVLLLGNLLLSGLLFLRRGHIYRNIGVVLLLWLYLLVVGFSPSAVRATLMMSFVQIAWGASERVSSVNLLCGAATFMLAISPYLLYDISFQLSFLAVAAILFLMPRLYRPSSRTPKLLRWFWASLALAISAQLGTLPLVAYTFGSLPLLAWLLNPVVVLLSMGIVLLGVLCLVLGFAPLLPLFSAVLELLITTQNTLLARVSAYSGSAIEGIALTSSTLYLIYTLLGVIALVWLLVEEIVRERQVRVR